jgi:hypothetical protein
MLHSDLLQNLFVCFQTGEGKGKESGKYLVTNSKVSTTVTSALKDFHQTCERVACSSQFASNFDQNGHHYS